MRAVRTRVAATREGRGAASLPQVQESVLEPSPKSAERTSLAKVRGLGRCLDSKNENLTERYSMRSGGAYGSGSGKRYEIRVI